jgi:hypothetical protein
MARRSLAAAAALAVALVSSVALAPARAHTDDSCATATVFAGAIGDAVGRGDDADWWRHPAVPGHYAVSLVSAPADADLVVGDGSCNALCDSDDPLGTDACDVWVADYALTVGVVSKSKTFDAAYTVTVTLLQPAVSACNDGTDNDGDGLVDFMADDGCSGSGDDTEDKSICSRRVAVEVCVEVTSGDPVRKLVLDTPGSKHHDVGAYVDSYRFGSAPPVPCVVLVGKPYATVNPCKKAGGTFVSRDRTLVFPKNLPDTPLSDSAVVEICDALITLTVEGKGADDFPGYAFC